MTRSAATATATDTAPHRNARGRTRGDDVAGMAGQLRLSATRLARRLRQEAGTGLSPSQLSALAQIERHGPLTLGTLAELERVAPPSVTRVVSKLEGDGLVTRQPSPLDRRSVHVSVTRTGAELLDRSRRRKDAWLASRLSELGAADRARLQDALDVLDVLADGETPIDDDAPPPGARP